MAAELSDFERERERERESDRVRDLRPHGGRPTPFFLTVHLDKH
jgi:hypothetical protein